MDECQRHLLRRKRRSIVVKGRKQTIKLPEADRVNPFLKANQKQRTDLTSYRQRLDRKEPSHRHGWPQRDYAKEADNDYGIYMLKFIENYGSEKCENLISLYGFITLFYVFRYTHF